MFGKKKMFQLGTVMLASAVLLAGCGTGSSSSNADDSKNTSFRIATVRWSDWGKAFLKGFVAKSEKQAGIKVKWDVYVNSDWGDKKSVVMSGGDLPDAFWGSIVLSDAEIAKNQDSFIPLEKYIKDMPNLQKAFKQDPKLKAMVTSPDGTYLLLTQENTDAAVNCQPAVHQQDLVGQTRLEDAGHLR
jgi:putative aldouronate transport system substrate-binding protein